MTPRKLPRKQECSASDEDYISNLPGDIICHIISFLPTTDAVKTSVLSKEWENKWTTIYNIDITDEKRKYSRRAEYGVAFINFMRRITKYATNVREIRMRLLMNYKVSETRSWISNLLRNQIEILLVETPSYSSTQLILRGSLLKATSLKEMVLRGPHFRVPTNICFKNLKSLNLEHVRLSNENSRSDTLVLNFPILETLEVSYCRWLVKHVEIYAPSLITFSSGSQRYFGELANTTINIHGGSLTEFASKGVEPEDIFVTGSKVVSANFDNVFYRDAEPSVGGLRILRLLKQFACSLDQLMLSFNAAEVILISNKGVSLTFFAKLRRLEFGSFGYVVPTVDNMYGYTQGLLELLHVMPCLKFLKLKVGYWDDFDYAALEYIPSCITSSLEKIEFVSIIYNKVSLLLLAKFLMKNALSLKEFYVRDYSKVVEDDFVEKISAYPTGSGHVKIAALPMPCTPDNHCK